MQYQVKMLCLFFLNYIQQLNICLGVHTSDKLYTVTEALNPK